MAGSDRRRPGRRIAVLWAVAALLLLTGVFAHRAGGAQQAQDTLAADTTSAPTSSADSVAFRVDAEAGATPQQIPDTMATGVGGAPPFSDTLESGLAPQRISDTRADVDTPFHARLVSLLGMVTLLVIGWLLSVNRAIIPWRIIAWGIGLQLVFALIILKTAAGAFFFDSLNDIVVALLGFTEDGARFLFGNLVQNSVPVGTGDPATGAFTPTAGTVAQTGAYFAFNVLPTIIFFSSLMTMLYYIGIMQWLVKGMAWVMMRTMRTSGAETLSTAGNIFLGQTEAPLLIKPFVGTMTMSELMAVMTGGFATVAGGVMAAYVGMLLVFFPDIAGHLMAASVMSAPAALVFAKLMYPETEQPMTRGELKVHVETPDANVIDAAARGAGEGLSLAANVGAMLLAFIALIALLNALLGWVGDVTRLADLLAAAGWLGAGQSLSLEWILGWLFAPLAWLMGVPWSDAFTVGSLLGVKTAVNEFVAYLQLAGQLSGGADLSPRSIVIATYALCGFANFSSIAIQIGGIGGIAPNRRSDLARIGLRAMIAGTLAAFMTATIAGMLV